MIQLILDFNCQYRVSLPQKIHIVQFPRNTINVSFKLMKYPKENLSSTL